jgi:hypothetical protein
LTKKNSGNMKYQKISHLKQKYVICKCYSIFTRHLLFRRHQHKINVVPYSNGPFFEIYFKWELFNSKIYLCHSLLQVLEKGMPEEFFQYDQNSWRYELQTST